MKIPHVVPHHIMEAYMPSPEELEVTEEADIIPFPAGNFDWDALIVPKLRDLALKQLSEMFDLIQPLTGTLQQDVNTLVEILPINVDLHLTVPLIFYEVYWERCCRGRWPEVVYSPRPYEGFWKQTYLTSYLEEHLEITTPELFDDDVSEDLALLVKDYVSVLNIKQLKAITVPPLPNCRDGIVRDECIRSDEDIPLDHIPLKKTLAQLTMLTSVRIVFCEKVLHDNYDPRLLRFSLADCELICAGLKSLPFLKAISINKCQLGDIKSKIFFRFIAQKESIEEIDFSHCYLGDDGLLALGGLLMEHSNLKVVKIRNNIFGPKGLQGLGYALTKPPKAPLRLLDLGMNFLSEESSDILSSALIRCKIKPTEVNMSCCGIKGNSGVMMAGMLALNTSMLKLDIRANDFSGEAEDKLMESMPKNRRLLEIDTRHSGISEECVLRVKEILERNKRFTPAEVVQYDIPIPPLYLTDPEYLVWEYNPTNPHHEPGHYPPRHAEN